MPVSFYSPLAFVIISAALAVPLVALAGSDKGNSQGSQPAGRPQVDVCHVPPGNPEQTKVLSVGAASLEAHLAHGDTKFGLDLAPDCSGGTSFTIDGSLVPDTPELPGIAGGEPRPVGVLQGPDGRRDEFVLGELDFKPDDEAELDEFLATYGAVIVRGDVTLVPTDNGGVEERPGGGWYLVRIDPSTSPLVDLPLLFTRAGVQGNFVFSSDYGARTLAALLREGERTLTPNLVLQPHAILEHPLVANPTLNPGNCARMPPPGGGPPGDILDFSLLPFMTEDDAPNTPGDQGLSTGVVRAWEYLRHTGLPPQNGEWEPAIVAIIDNAFSVDPITGRGSSDYLFNPPPQVDLQDFDGTADGPAPPPFRWHGEDVFGVCCARPRNLFGGAGRGGEYVRPLLIKTPLGFADIASSVRTAWIRHADVINMSLGAQCNWLCDVGDFFVESHLQEEIITATAFGATVFASAGNGPGNMGVTNFNVADGDWIPCEMNRVTCIGAVDGNGNNVWNWGNGVDFWAPTNTLSTVTPASAAADGDNVGCDELNNFGGTSSASPFAAGVAGLLKTAAPGLLWNEVQQTLIDTANASGDFRVATGYVDALRAVQAVRANPPPTVQFGEPDDGDEFSWAPTYLFFTSPSDPVAPGVFRGNVTISSDLDGTVCSNDSSPWSCFTQLRTLGTHTLTATVTDEFGAMGTDTIQVEVFNEAPRVTLLSPPDGSTRFTDQEVQFRATASDDDLEVFAQSCPAPVDTACIQWTSSLDGEVEPPPGADPLSFGASLSEGVHVITVEARDGKGETDQASATVTVLAGTGVPTAVIDAPPDGAIIEVGDLVVTSGRGLDPEDGDLSGASLVWTSSVAGFLGTGSSVSFHMEPVVEVIALEVTDSDGNTATDQITIRGFVSPD
jgi:hypothetical protein